ncbi:MAG: hypothetical protein LBT13_08890 [Treponema sp.]|jgi:hypothetical protein|nr:hypothetical protein [Treponema sp.]
MAKRTQIVCIHEGTKGASIDPVFANAFLKSYDPEWVRPWKTGVVRFVACRGKSELLDAFPMVQYDFFCFSDKKSKSTEPKSHLLEQPQFGPPYNSIRPQR